MIYTSKLYTVSLVTVSQLKDLSRKMNKNQSELIREAVDRMYQEEIGGSEKIVVDEMPRPTDGEQIPIVLIVPSSTKTESEFRE